MARDLLRTRGSRYFGIEALVLSYEMANILNVPQESGWLVQHVVGDSPAGKLGIKGGFRMVTIDDQEIMLGGDIILQVDDIKITGEESLYQIWEYLNSSNAATTYTIKVLRKGEIIELRWVSAAFQPMRQ